MTKKTKIKMFHMSDTVLETKNIFKLEFLFFECPANEPILHVLIKFITFSINFDVLGLNLQYTYFFGNKTPPEFDCS